jgi:hypothetical protein
MARLTILSRRGPILAVAAVFLFAASERAEAQFGIGVGDPGGAFMFYVPENVPSPTNFLYDHHKGRIDELGNSLQAHHAASQAGAHTPGPQAYFNNLRDFSGANTYDVNSRRSLNSRTAPPRPRAQPQPQPQPRPAEPQVPDRTTALKLSAFFLPSGAFDWPGDAPETGSLSSAKTEAASAVKAVHDEIRSAGKARAQTIAFAKSKLVAYGRYALVDVRANRSETVGHVFHYFLLYLHDALNRLGQAG